MVYLHNPPVFLYLICCYPRAVALSLYRLSAEHSKRPSFPTHAPAGAPPMGTPSFNNEDHATEERINQILSEAQAAMQAKQNQEKVRTDSF